MKKKNKEENLLVAIMTCVLAIAGVMMMRIFLKIDFQAWSLFYIAAACTAAIRWTPSGTSISVGSALRALGCLVVGLYAIKFAGYPGALSFQTASLVPHEIMDALAHFHVFYE
jgi:hypothetical protein